MLVIYIVLLMTLVTYTVHVPWRKAWSLYFIHGQTCEIHSLWLIHCSAAVIIALGIGVLLSRYNWTSNLFWWLIGSGGAALLYFTPRYWSFIGGLMLGVYTMSIWPAMIDRLFCRPVARTLTLANLVYIVLTLGSVWVVAFNFVPGGEYTRERTHVLLAITMVLIGK